MNSLISHFPMPYPDEWWYSVLCRYYIRSGSPNYQDIFLELFGNKKQKLERLIPNGTHKMILDRLPEIGLTSNDVLFHHTILPCYPRGRRPSDWRYRYDAHHERRPHQLSSCDLLQQACRGGYEPPARRCRLCYWFHGDHQPRGR